MAYSYVQEDGSVANCSLLSSVPEGASYSEVSEFPDKAYRDAWILQGNQVVLDATKVAEVDYAAAKVNRAATVDAITVTTSLGNTYNGDENSQNRMSRAVSVGSPGDTTGWKLADNSVVEVTWEDLKEALYLAGIAQTEAWMI